MSRRRPKNPRQSQHWRPREDAHSTLMLGNGMRALLPWNDTHGDREPGHFGTCFQMHAHAEPARDKRTEGLLPVHEEQR
jgi:hypothetical protein